MEKQDIRWMQRYGNYRKALARLGQAVALVDRTADAAAGEIDELLKEGLVQRFEYTHELAWNVMRDYEIYQGYSDIRGSRDAIRKALEINLIDDARWMKSIEDRNLSSHEYDDKTAEAVVRNIRNVYYPLFCAFERVMSGLSEATSSLFE